MNNEDQVAGFHALGDEIWAQTRGQIDAFVHVVGTGGSIRGSSAALRRYDPELRVIAVEPTESPVLSGGEPGAHGIEGIGAGYIVPLWDPILADDILTVSTGEAKEMAQRLAREEGIFAGISSGANVVAAVRVAEELPQGTTVVTLLIDSGLKYLSTDLYKEA
jgi:cysteine synthase A